MIITGSTGARMASVGSMEFSANPSSISRSLIYTSSSPLVSQSSTE